MYMKINMYKIIILISGNGSNLQAIIDTIQQEKLPIQVALVISDRPSAFGLERAQKARIKTTVISSKDHATRESYDKALQETIDQQDPDLIVLAGFMRILGKAFVQHFLGRLINIHPSLLPHYKGLHTHEKVLAAKEKEHGATVHLVTEDLDGGPILAFSKLNVEPDDTPESLQQRVHLLEHRLYPTVIRWFAEDRLSCLPEGVFFEGKHIPANGILL